MSSKIGSVFFIFIERVEKCCWKCNGTIAISGNIFQLSFKHAAYSLLGDLEAARRDDPIFLGERYFGAKVYFKRGRAPLPRLK